MAQDQSFRFLFRQEEGRIGQATWRRGTAGLALVLALLTAIWLWIAPNAHRSLDNTPLVDARTLLTYSYLILFALAILLIGVCHYMLSAKRWRDRGRPPALAGLLPLAALLAGAAHWLAPRMGDSMPGWIVLALDAVLAGVLACNALELGVLPGRAEK